MAPLPSLKLVASSTGLAFEQWSNSLPFKNCGCRREGAAFGGRPSGSHSGSANPFMTGLAFDGIVGKFGTSRTGLTLDLWSNSCPFKSYRCCRKGGAFG